jgi:hypothetical protein
LLPLDLSAAVNLESHSLLRDDPQLATVWETIRHADPTGYRFASVLRNTIDQLLNGEVSGRYDWKTLYQTEKTHAGSLVEINLQREFQFDNGSSIDLDYQIAGIDVDCKYSQKFGSWMIPPEALGHLCLLVWADDAKSRWSAGIMRIEEKWLNFGKNRDLKMTIKAGHRNRIVWLWHQESLPENVLLHLDDERREAILACASGQARVNELFRLVQNKRVGRGVVRTLGQQLDPMARVREGKGRARTVLREQGILIAGHYASHQEIARKLRAEVPRPGELVSFRVVRAQQRHDGMPSVELDGEMWVRAGKDDPEEPGPRLPKHTESQ